MAETKGMKSVNPWRAWLEAHPVVDVGLALFSACISVALSFYDVPFRQKLTQGVLADARWSSFTGTVAGVSATLIGFLAASIAIALALGSGQRGRAIFQQAGSDLSRMMSHCLGGATIAIIVLAIASGLQPSQSPKTFGSALTFVLVLLLLRMTRLWQLFYGLLTVYVLDSAEISEREPVSKSSPERMSE